MNLSKSTTKPSLMDVFLPEFVAFLKKALPDVKQSLLESASEIIEEHADLVQHWITLASSGALSSADLKWLIKSNLDLSSMIALKEGGLALVKIDELRQAMVSSLVSSIFKTNILR